MAHYAQGERHLLRNIVLFARALRAAGVDVTPNRVRTLVQALEHVSVVRRNRFRRAARTTLVGRREHLVTFNRIFELFWQQPGRPPQSQPEFGQLLQRSGSQRRRVVIGADDTARATAAGELTQVPRPETHSAVERLRYKDFADLTAAELLEIEALLKRQIIHTGQRRTRRWEPARSGPNLDWRRTLRISLRHRGEPVLLARQQRRAKHRPLVVLCDISGSMEVYSRLLLQFLHTIGRGGVRLEVFVFGTRLTRLTRELRRRDVSRALPDATAAIVDWGGGTRIGRSLREFNFRWGRRVLGHGALVAIISDGWDRGNIELLEDEMLRLHRGCHRLLWLNPLLGSPGYRPLARGMRTALPYVQDFLPVHNLASLEQLREVFAERVPKASRKSSWCAQASALAGRSTLSVSSGHA